MAILHPCKLIFIFQLMHPQVWNFVDVKLRPWRLLCSIIILRGPYWNAEATVCVGSEWHRYPSSFFLPSSHYRVAWLDDGFTGLLPRPFDPSLGGTTAAPQHFNSKNKASPDQFVSSLIPHVLGPQEFIYCPACYMEPILLLNDRHMFGFQLRAKPILSDCTPFQQLADESKCDYLVELVLDRDDRTYRSKDEKSWKVSLLLIFLTIGNECSLMLISKHLHMTTINVL